MQCYFNDKRERSRVNLENGANQLKSSIADFFSSYKNLYFFTVWLRFHMSPTDDKLCILPFQHLRCRCLSITFTTSDWHLRTWLRDAHSGGRLTLDSKSLEVFFNLNSPVLTQISFRAIPVFDCRCTKEMISLLRASVKRKTWPGSTLRKQTN